MTIISKSSGGTDHTRAALISAFGRIVDIVEDGQMVGRRIEGGTVHKVSKGDFLVIPEGVPHQVTEFDPSLLIVTFEFPR